MRFFLFRFTKLKIRHQRPRITQKSKKNKKNSYFFAIFDSKIKGIKNNGNQRV